MTHTVRCTNPGCVRCGVVAEVRAVPVGQGFEQRGPVFCSVCGLAAQDVIPHERARKAVRKAPERR